MKCNTITMRAVVAIALFSVMANVHADAGQSNIVVGHPWARATPPVEPTNAAVYLTIENRTDHTIRFTGASTSLTDQVSLHQTREDQGMMRMKAMKDGLKIAAGESARLEPMGYHLMLRNLTKPLKKGDEFPLTLKFADGQTMKAHVKVGARPDSGAM